MEHMHLFRKFDLPTSASINSTQARAAPLCARYVHAVFGYSESQCSGEDAVVHAKSFRLEKGTSAQAQITCTTLQIPNSQHSLVSYQSL
jgi:hypothetical protein